MPLNMNAMAGMTPEQMDAFRKQQYADLLTKQAQDPLQGQMVSGHYIAPSWTQQLAKVLSGVAGNYMQGKATDALKASADAQRADFQNTAQKYVQALRGTPEQNSVSGIPMPDQNTAQAYSKALDTTGSFDPTANTSLMPSMTGANEPLTTIPSYAPATHVAAQPGDPVAAMNIALGSNSPQMQALGMQQLAAAAKPASWKLGEIYGDKGMKQKIVYNENDPSQYRVLGNTEADKIIADNLGGTLQYRGEHSTEPLGTANKTASPDALLTDERTRQENALNRALTARGQAITLRGQDLTNARALENTAIARQNAKPLTEVQGKAAMFGARAAEADKILNQLEGKYSRTALATKTGLDNTWGIGGILSPIANAALSPDAQKADQAQRDFVNAVLRQESGAAISESEFNNARKQYFPQPGDSDAVVKQKARNRQTAIEGFKNIAGRGAYEAPPMPDAQPKTSGMPRAGTVQGGYMFKGGNPADPNSWVKQ